MECPKDLVYCYFVNELIYLFMYTMHTIWYLYCMYVLNMYHNACIKCFIIQSIVMILKVRSLFTGWSIRNHTLWTGKDEGKCSYVGIGKKFIILHLKFPYQYLHEGKLFNLFKTFFLSIIEVFYFSLKRQLITCLRLHTMDKGILLTVSL